MIIEIWEVVHVFVCVHVVDVGSTVLLHIHLTVFGISGGEVVKVVPIVEPNLKKA